MLLDMSKRTRKDWETLGEAARRLLDTIEARIGRPVAENATRIDAGGVSVPRTCPGNDEAERPPASDAGSIGSGFTMETGGLSATHVGCSGMPAASIGHLAGARAYVGSLPPVYLGRRRVVAMNDNVPHHASSLMR
jgi:hypothetical protein